MYLLMDIVFIGVTGSELAILSTLAPFLLGIEPFRKTVASHSGQCVTRACVLLGMASYALSTPLYRLFIVSFASMALSIDWAVAWSGMSDHINPKDNSPSAFYNTHVKPTHALQFSPLVSSLPTCPNWRTTPTTPFGLLSTRALVDGTRPDSLLPFWPWPSLPIDHRSLNTVTQLLSSRVQTAQSGGWLALAWEEPCLLSTRYSLTRAPSLLGPGRVTQPKFVSNNHRGVPSSPYLQGPIPGLNSSPLTIAALCTGLALASSTSGMWVINHRAWPCIGAAACFTMYYFRDWTGYAGGLVYGFFLMSVFPRMLQESAFRGGALVYFLSWMVTILLILADVRATWANVRPTNR